MTVYSNSTEKNVVKHLKMVFVWKPVSGSERKNMKKVIVILNLTVEILFIIIVTSDLSLATLSHTCNLLWWINSVSPLWIKMVAIVFVLQYVLYIVQL